MHQKERGGLIPSSIASVSVDNLIDYTKQMPPILKISFPNCPIDRSHHTPSVPIAHWSIMKNLLALKSTRILNVLS